MPNIALYISTYKPKGEDEPLALATSQYAVRRLSSVAAEQGYGLIEREAGHCVVITTDKPELPPFLADGTAELSFAILDVMFPTSPPDDPPPPLGDYSEDDTGASAYEYERLGVKYVRVMVTGTDPVKVAALYRKIADLAESQPKKQ